MSSRRSYQNQRWSKLKVVLKMKVIVNVKLKINIKEKVNSKVMVKLKVNVNISFGVLGNIINNDKVKGKVRIKIKA